MFIVTYNLNAVFTVDDFEQGGFVDFNPNDFGFETRAEAETLMQSLIEYANEKHPNVDHAKNFAIFDYDKDDAIEF